MVIMRGKVSLALFYSLLEALCLTPFGDEGAVDGFSAEVVDEREVLVGKGVGLDGDLLGVCGDPLCRARRRGDCRVAAQTLPALHLERRRAKERERERERERGCQRASGQGDRPE